MHTLHWHFRCQRSRANADVLTSHEGRRGDSRVSSLGHHPLCHCFVCAMVVGRRKETLANAFNLQSNAHTRLSLSQTTHSLQVSIAQLPDQRHPYSSGAADTALRRPQTALHEHLVSHAAVMIIFPVCCLSTQCHKPHFIHRPSTPTSAFYSLRSMCEADGFTIIHTTISCSSRTQYHGRVTWLAWLGVAWQVLWTIA